MVLINFVVILMRVKVQVNETNVTICNNQILFQVNFKFEFCARKIILANLSPLRNPPPSPSHPSEVEAVCIKVALEKHNGEFFRAT